MKKVCTIEKVLLGVLLPVLVLVCMSGSKTSAASLPTQTIVTGVITKNQAAEANLSVTATCNNHTLTDTTDARGSYLVNFPVSQCSYGNTIKVSATNGFYSGAGSGTAAGISPRLSLVTINFAVNFVAESDVDGVISNNAGSVAGATVTVVCNGNKKTGTASATGAYHVVFPVISSGSNGAGCPAGSAVRVTANNANESGLSNGSVHIVTAKLNTAVINVSIATFGPVVFTEYPIPGWTLLRDPQSVTTGPDGNVWFTNPLGSSISKITTAGVITKYPLWAGVSPNGIVAGPDGSVWFTERDNGKICKISTTGVLTRFPTTVNHPSGITVGPNGNLWFAETGALGEITPAGLIAHHPINASFVLNPVAITLGSDGNLWFTSGSSNISKMTPSGTLTTYRTNSGIATDGITTGPDGNVWYTDGPYGSNKIYKITPSGTITSYAFSAGSAAGAITTGPDGNLWFTETSGKKIGRITPSGVVTEYDHPTAIPNQFNGLNQYGITTGPDGNLWFTGTGTITKMNL